MPVKAFTYRMLQFASVILASCVVSACEEESNNAETIGLGWIDFSINLTDNVLAPQNGSFALSLQEIDTEYSRVWSDISNFPNYDNFYVGAYKAQAYSGDVDAEGYGCQAYYGEAEFQVLESQTTRVAINCKLAQTMADVNITDESADYKVSKVTFHTMGWGYVDAQTDQDTPALLHPGSTRVWVALENITGKIATIDPSVPIATEAGHLNQCYVNISNENILTVEWGDRKFDLELSEDYFNSEAPTIDCVGFTPEVPVKLVEGYPSTETIAMDIHAPAGLASVMVSVQSDNNTLFNFPYEFNMLEDAAKLEEYGWVVERHGDCDATIDYSKMLEQLSIDYNSTIRFNAVACDRLGRLSPITSLKVELESVDILNINCTKAVIGENIATINLQMTTDVVQASDFTLYTIDTATGEIDQEVTVIKSTIDEDSNTVSLIFAVENGIAPVAIKIYYLNKPRHDVMIYRAVPEYSLSLDAYSTYILAQIGIESTEALREITKYVHFYDGETQYAVTERDTERGIVKIDGLSPNSLYKLTAVVVSDEFAPVAQTRTEAAALLPGGDFEDVKFNFSYDNLPQGGAYSSTAFPIYNMQNTQSVYVNMPEKYWCGVNEKTFNKAAKNHNTWYMQASAEIDNSISVSGSKSVHISSVGWSLDGAEILPYTQSEDGYLPYNANVPDKDHVSAGRFFLGEYQFNPNTLEETYSEGIKFTSRPSSLNGFVRYLPDAQNDYDQGVLIVQVVNDDLLTPVVIAEAKMNIKPCSDFIAFNLPLEYEIFGVKASRLLVIFCSSSQYGDIDYEDQNVPVTADVANSRYIGSQMWIDNLSLSY